MPERSGARNAVGRHLVTAERVAGTYSGGEERYLDYLRAIELRRNGARPASIARTLGRKHRTVYHWIQGIKPASVKGVEEIRHLLPLHLGHPLFQHVNIVAAWAFWSGGISRRHFQLSFSESREKLGGLATVLSRLGVKRMRFYPQALGSNYALVFHGKRALARAVHVLGVPAETKTNLQLELPPYVRECVARVRAGRGSRAEKSVVKGFAGVLLSTRAGFSGRGYFPLQVQLNATRTRESARRFGEQAAELVEAATGVRPVLKVSEYATGFAPTLSIKVQHLPRIASEHAYLFRFNPMLLKRIRQKLQARGERT